MLLKLFFVKNLPQNLPLYACGQNRWDSRFLNAFEIVFLTR